eukprot:Transcript_19468.p3 GENE.Transcript_19468~~Transcript_19468.p3  ORF type:complete len:274 (+),score=138.59 Transcript_19468:477-1298(+)
MYRSRFGLSSFFSFIRSFGLTRSSACAIGICTDKSVTFWPGTGRATGLLPPPPALPQPMKAAEKRPVARPVPGQNVTDLSVQMPIAHAELRVNPKDRMKEKKELKPKRERYMDRCDPVLRFRVGEKLECRMEAQGYEKSWYKAEILQIKEDGSIKVQYPELEEEDRKGVMRPSEEWVKSDRLRPFPPELVPEEYLGSIEVGDCVEMQAENGWWQMEVLANPLLKELPGEADVDPAAPSNLTKSDQLKVEAHARMNRPEPTPEEAAPPCAPLRR